MLARDTFAFRFSDICISDICLSIMSIVEIHVLLPAPVDPLTSVILSSVVDLSALVVLSVSFMICYFMLFGQSVAY